MMGIGKEKSSVRRLVASVFLMIFPKSDWRKYLNQPMPFQGAWIRS